MVKVSIRVRNGAARFDVAVSAESVERAVSLAGRRYTGDVLHLRTVNSSSFRSGGSR